MEKAAECSVHEKNIVIKKMVLVSPAFGQAFQKLLAIERLPIKQKMDLVRVQKTFDEFGEVLNSSVKGRKEEEVKEFLSGDFSFVFPKIDVMLVIEQLSAKDLCLLEPLMENMED